MRYSGLAARLVAQPRRRHWAGFPGGLDLQSLASLRMAMASRMRFSVSPQVRTIGIVDGRQAFATLSQLPNIDSKRLVKKTIHLDADILAAIKKEASRVNFGLVA